MEVEAVLALEDIPALRPPMPLSKRPSGRSPHLCLQGLCGEICRDEAEIDGC